MTFHVLRSYDVQYLLSYRFDTGAGEDAVATGYYKHRAVMVGETENDIITAVRDLGGVPVRVQLLKAKNALFRRLSADYKKQFLMAIYFNCSAMSAARALESVIESDTSTARELLNSSLAIIRSGGSFIDAVDALAAYDESTIAILEAGERTGTLKHALKTAVEHLDASAKSSKLMGGMALFTGLEMLFAFSSVVGNRYGLLPHISSNIPEGLSAEKLQAMKTALKLAYWSADAMLWGTCALFIVVMLGLYSYFDNDKVFRKWVDDRVMRIPVLSKALLHAAVANSFKVVASLLHGGVHFQAAIAIAEKSTRVPSVQVFWLEAATRSENGDSVAATLSQGLLDNSDRLLVAAHANRSQLADSMTLIAARRDDMALRAAKRFGIVSFIATTLYSTLAVVGSLYVLWIQNEALLSGVKG